MGEDRTQSMTDGHPVPASADCVVIGLGIMGSAAVNALARAGVDVAGIDRFTPPHDQGSSHGQTRLVRLAYAEGAHYVPMMNRAISLWRDLEARTGARLFHQTGILYAGPPGGDLLSGVELSAERHGIRLTYGSLDDLGIDENLFGLKAGWDHLFEADAGYVLAEAAVQALLDEALRHGATLSTGNRFLGLETDGQDRLVHTDRGTIRARTVVFTSGPWIAGLHPSLAPLIRLERRVLCWFRDPTGSHRSGLGFTPFAFEIRPDRWFYGFPDDLGTGVKVAVHGGDDPLSTPEMLRREITDDDAAEIDTFTQGHLPLLGSRIQAAACMYTMSPDEDFILDTRPGDGQVFLATGFSGHGFKFAPLIGSIIANHVTGQPEEVDLAPFRLARFTG